MYKFLVFLKKIQEGYVVLNDPDQTQGEHVRKRYTMNGQTDGLWHTIKISHPKMTVCTLSLSNM